MPNFTEGRKEMFYLMTHSTHFIYGYMASDIWLRTILIVGKETRCRHIGYSFRLTARVLLYAPSHRQDSTYHGLCYTSSGALAGTRNSSMGPPMKDRPDDPSHHERTLYLWATSRSHLFSRMLNFTEVPLYRSRFACPLTLAPVPKIFSVRLALLGNVFSFIISIFLELRHEIGLWKKASLRITAVSREESVMKALILQKKAELENALSRALHRRRWVYLSRYTYNTYNAWYCFKMHFLWGIA